MFQQRLKELRKKKHMTQRQLADKLFVDCSSVTKWETGKAFPDFENQKKLSEVFQCSIDYLLGISFEKNFFSAELTYMKVIGTVKAGYDGIAYEEYSEETVPIPATFLNGGDKEDFFLLRVSGNSMYPKLIDGDIVLVKKKSSVDSGSIAVVMFGNEEATVKTVKYAKGENQLDLIPANPEYETKHIKGSDIENCLIIGQVIKLIRDL